jgi:hypothetical protein
MIDMKSVVKHVLMFIKDQIMNNKMTMNTITKIYSKSKNHVNNYGKSLIKATIFTLKDIFAPALK